MAGEKRVRANKNDRPPAGTGRSTAPIRTSQVANIRNRSTQLERSDRMGDIAQGEVVQRLDCAVVNLMRAAPLMRAMRHECVDLCDRA